MIVVDSVVQNENTSIPSLPLRFKLSQTKITVERTFGILKNRYRLLLQESAAKETDECIPDHRELFSFAQSND